MVILDLLGMGLLMLVGLALDLALVVGTFLGVFLMALLMLLILATMLIGVIVLVALVIAIAMPIIILIVVVLPPPEQPGAGGTLAGAPLPGVVYMPVILYPRLFLGTVKRSRLHALFIVTVATGLRSCEVRALREEDYDPPFLHIRQKVRRVRGGWIFDSYLKTKAGERSVTLPPFAQAVLAEGMTGKGGLLFRAQNGGPLHTTFVQVELDRIAKAAGIPRLRFHDLRHTQGTVLASAGVAPQIIQRRLGHSRIGVTMDLYAHKTPGQDAPAAEMLERILGDDAPPDEEVSRG